MLLLDPGHDLIVLVDKFIQSAFGLFGLPRLIRRLRTGQAAADAEAADGVLATLRLYGREYLNRQPKVMCPEIGNLLVDPYPCLRWLGFRLRPRVSYVFRRLSRSLGLRPANGPEAEVKS